MSTSATPASSRRFWIVVAFFAIANAAVWLVYDRAQHRHQRGELRVEAVEPQDISSAGPRPTVRWHFNNDVVPSSDYGRAPGSVTPALQGHWTWDDPQTLSFTPDADLPRAQRISFTLSDLFLRSRGGGTMEGPYVTDLDSAPLTVQSVQQIASKPMDQFVFEMQFSDVVSPRDVLAHLQAWTFAGQKVKCDALGLANGRTVRIQTDSIPKADDDKTADISLILSAGLTGQSGPLGLASDYHTTVQLERALAAMELQAESPLRDQPHLSLRFNNDIDPKKLKDVLSIDPATACGVQSQGDGMVNLTGDFKPGQRYVVTIAPPPPGAAADTYPIPTQLSAFIPDRDSGVWLDTTQGYLSSAGNRTILAHAVNVDAVNLRITRVYDNNIVSWRNQSSQDDWNDTESFSTPVAERKLRTTAPRNSVKDLHLSLDDLLPPGTSDGVFRVTLTAVNDNSTTSSNDNAGESDEGPSAVVTLSDIGLTAKRTREGLIVWATSLRTAKPLEGVRIRVFSSKSQPLGEAITDSDGLATLAKVQPAKDETAAVVLADVIPVESPLGPYIAAKLPATQPARALTWLDLRNTAWDLGDSDTNGRAYLHRGYEAYIYTDRGVYRPGETVHLRAIVRGPDNTMPETVFPVRWLISRPDLHDWREQTAILDADGAAKFDVTIPAEMPTGEWTAKIGLPGDTDSADRDFGSVKFQVEEFIPNRIKATLAFKGDEGDKTPARFNTADGNLTAEIQSDYLFGRPASGLTVELTTMLKPVPFSAPAWTDWTFGDSGHVNPAEESSDSPTQKTKPRRQTQEQTLDSAGHFEWSIDAGSALGLSDKAPGNEQGPWELTASAGVRETGGRAVTVAKQIFVDALPAYIGARRDANTPALPGERCPLQLAMVRPDASLLQSNDALDATLSRETWNTSLVYDRRHYHYESTRVLEPITKSTVQLFDGKATWSPVAPSSGSYVALFRNKKTGAMTSLTFDVTDGSPWDDNVSRDRPDRLTVRVLPPGTGPATQPSQVDKQADSQNFSAGDNVNVLIASPFAGRLLLTVETDEVVQRRVIDMAATHVVVPVQLSEACRPNAFISATVIRPIDPNAKWQTHRAYGVMRVRIDPSDQRLNIALTAPAELRPEQSLDVGIVVTDATGAPAANTPVTVAAVDEGICALTNFLTPDPLKYFSADRALGVDSADIFDLLAPEVAKADNASAVGGDATAAVAARHTTPIVAKRVKPLSLAWSEVRTDAQGVARASFPLPQFQGRLRVMAVAYNAAGLGSADRPVAVHSPVLSQSSWPRFAAPTDRFTVPVVLFNNTASSGQAKVSVELQPDPATPSGLLGFGEHPQSRLELPNLFLPAHGQRQVDLPVTVGTSAGVAHVRLQVDMNGDTFEESLELPVRPAAPMVQYGGYAIASTTQPAEITAPTAILKGTGTLAIRVSPWPTLRLSQGLDYLDRYPYGCVEQTTSTCFPLLALSDIGKQIDPRRFDPDQIKSKITAGILDIIGMQTADGGLAMWPAGTETWPWGSVYASHFIVEARRAGYDVPDDFYNRLLKNLHQQLSTGTDDPEQLETQAYAAYVLALAGEAPRTMMDRLAELATAKALPDEDQDHAAMRSDARLFLACARAISGRTDLANELIPDALPLPRLHRQSAGNVGSPIRDRALLIYAIANVQPTNPALPDLVQHLVDDGAQNKWDSTQDTAFAMLALSQYLHHLPHPKPFDSAQLSYGANILAQEQGEPSLALNVADPAAGTPYAVNIKGAAGSSAYVSWLETGVPLSPPPDAQHGIAIHRRYLSLDGTELHSASSGQLVRVELTINAPANQPNLIIEDLLPAGLEAENAQLATSAKDDDDQADSDKKSGFAKFISNRLDVRDDRVVVMGSMPGTNQARCEYLARAVTPGVYVIPPVRAEAMYDIATCGISGAVGTFTVSQDHASLASIHE